MTSENRRAVGELSTAVFLSDVSGTGTMTGRGTVFFEGTFSPGASPGRVTIEGDSVFSPRSTLYIEIGGTDPGVEYDQVFFGGDLAMSARLDVCMLNDFVPRRGDQFDIIAWEGNRIGELKFESMRLPGQTFLIADDRDQMITLVAAGPGDANLDGRFDTLDVIMVFQAGEYEDDVPMNSTWSEGDWDLDGDFGTGDLIFALQHGDFESRGVAAVPEPSPKVLLIVGVLALIRTRSKLLVK